MIKLVEVNKAGENKIIDYFYYNFKNDTLYCVQVTGNIFIYNNPTKNINLFTKIILKIKNKYYKNCNENYFINNNSILFRKI